MKLDLLKTPYRIVGLLIIAFVSHGFVVPPDTVEVKGWTILSDSYEDALATIEAAPAYGINHLQLSHNLVMDLCEMKKAGKRQMVEKLVSKAHSTGIKEVVLWDHALYDLDYYPQRFKTGPKGTLDLDNPEFWNWFKADYREMMKLLPEVDGLVLTFIETGARAEKQHSLKLKTNEEKLAAVVDAVASVVCDELDKKLYIRTFAYTDAEYRNTIGCIEHIKSQRIVLMMKETPHDFFLTHPNDKYAGTINRPTIIEFDCGNEFNGQGIIANTWPQYILKRWSDFLRRPNIIGYTARTDRYGDTRVVGHPSEILLYTLKRYTEDTSLNANRISEEFIRKRYGEKAVPFVKPAFDLSFEIVTSVLYTLGTNMANHSKLNFDPYGSSYGRHVSGKWIDPPYVYVAHDVNRKFHYWKDVIDHLAPARLKTADGPIKTEAPFVIFNQWVTPEEKMDTSYYRYILHEKAYGVKLATQALSYIKEAYAHLSLADYLDLYQTFQRTLLTAQLYEAVSRAYWGYRIYARGKQFQTPELKASIRKGLDEMMELANQIKTYPYKYPIGQWNWKEDADMALHYHDWITFGWKEYGGVAFSE